MNSEHTILGVGEIPKDWRIEHLSDIGEIITGNTPSTKNRDYYGGKYLFVKPPDLIDNKYVYDTETKLTKIGFEKGRTIPKNSVMVTCIGSIGEIGISSQDVITNQQINTIVCGKNSTHEYIYYNLMYRKEFLKIYANQSLLPIINKSDFSKINIPIPPLVEQRGIAEILSTVDEATHQTKAIIEKTEGLKKALMQRLLTRGIEHTEFKQTELRDSRLLEGS